MFALSSSSALNERRNVIYIDRFPQVPIMASQNLSSMIGLLEIVIGCSRIITASKISRKTSISMVFWTNVTIINHQRRRNCRRITTPRICENGGLRRPKLPAILSSVLIQVSKDETTHLCGEMNTISVILTILYWHSNSN